MKQAKVVLVTSDWEGVGIVTTETFILRTPVLLTDGGGMHELVLDYPEIGCDTEDEFVCKTKEILSESSEWKIVYDKIYKEQECQNNLQDYLNF